MPDGADEPITTYSKDAVDSSADSEFSGLDALVTASAGVFDNVPSFAAIHGIALRRNAALAIIFSCW